MMRRRYDSSALKTHVLNDRLVIQMHHQVNDVQRVLIKDIIKDYFIVQCRYEVIYKYAPQVVEIHCWLVDSNHNMLLMQSLMFLLLVCTCWTNSRLIYVLSHFYARVTLSLVTCGYLWDNKPQTSTAKWGDFGHFWLYICIFFYIVYFHETG